MAQVDYHIDRFDEVDGALAVGAARAGKIANGVLDGRIIGRDINSNTDQRKIVFF